MTARLMCLLDGLSAGRGAAVVVLATTSRVSALDPALRRPGRLDVEVRTMAGVSSSLRECGCIRCNNSGRLKMKQGF